jgi:hypothetical protein
VNPLQHETESGLSDLLSYLRTYSLHIKSPSLEANRFSTSQEIHRILWNPKFHYRIHKCPPPVYILSQTNPIHASPSHVLKIQFNIILPSTPRSSKWSLSFRFRHQNPLCTSPLFYACCMPSPSNCSHLIIRKIFVELYKSLSYSLCNYFHSLVTLSLLGPNILLNTLF